MLRSLLRHRSLIAMLAIATFVGALAAKYNTRGNLLIGGAAVHIMVDDPDASILYRSALDQDVSNLEKRAELYGRLLTTRPVLDAVGRHAGIPADEISGIGRTTADVPIPLLEPGTEERASQIESTRAPYRLEMQSDFAQPIFTVYAEAPSYEAAEKLADSVVPGLQDYLRGLARRQGVSPGALPVLRQLGSARGGPVNTKARYVIGALTFVTGFGLTFAVLFLIRRRRRAGRPRAPAPVRRPALTGRAAADWPHTTRVLPWSVAGLIAMFWLVPFDRIQLKFHTPVDMTLDRFALPAVAFLWAVAFLAGPGAAPRLRLTKAHLALGGLLACAFLSVVLDARYLNQTGELMLAFKKLPLLFSYVALFVLVASSVRRSEVPAFLHFTLVLSVICGLGVIYEARMHTNPFLLLANAVFHAPFEVLAGAKETGVDAQGRLWVQGPTIYGVEVTAMLSMALPIAVLGMVKTKLRKRKALYGLAIAILMAAMIETQRKSALVVPVAAVVALAYYRRKELLSLAPLGLLMIALAAVVAPRTLHAVVSQFTRSDATQVATVSDRVSDYDAIRPDVFTHLLFGRGYGTYTHDTYRILDSEVLGKLIETGVVGVVVYLLFPICVILIARKTASTRHPVWSAPAVCGVASALCFIVVSTLYDVMSAPHAPDTFLYLAALTTVVAVGGDDDAPARAERRHAARTHAPSGARRPASPRSAKALV